MSEIKIYTLTKEEIKEKFKDVKPYKKPLTFTNKKSGGNKK